MFSIPTFLYVEFKRIGIPEILITRLKEEDDKGFCKYCGESFPMKLMYPSGKKREFCGENCRKGYGLLCGNVRVAYRRNSGRCQKCKYACKIDYHVRLKALQLWKLYGKACRQQSAHVMDDMDVAEHYERFLRFIIEKLKTLQQEFPHMFDDHLKIKHRAHYQIVQRKPINNFMYHNLQLYCLACAFDYSPSTVPLGYLEHFIDNFAVPKDVPPYLADAEASSPVQGEEISASEVIQYPGVEFLPWEDVKMPWYTTDVVKDLVAVK